MPWLLGFMSKGFFKWGLVLTVLLGILWQTYKLGGDHVRAAWDVERAQVGIANALETARLAELQQSTTREYLKQYSRLRENTRTIIEKVPVYVTKQDDANCHISDGFVRLHDKATGRASVPGTDSPSGTDGSSESVELSDVGRTVAGNYSTCRETALRLEQLQNWVKKIGAQGP